MIIQFRSISMFTVVLISAGLMIGCGGPTDPAPAPSGGGGEEVVDPHDVPITDAQKEQLKAETAKYADAVERIVTFLNIIETETKDGIPANPFEAHQALDKADLLLQWLPDVTRDSEVPKDQWETVNLAAGGIRELLDTIHLNIDKKADPDYASAKEKIDAHIVELRAVDQ